MNTKLAILVATILLATNAHAWNNTWRTEPRSTAFGGSPAIYSADGKYLGNLNNNRFDPNSVANPYGRYGSQFSVDSINNQFGPYGSQFSPQGASNPYGMGYRQW